jgi:predicted dehydrogenase
MTVPRHAPAAAAKITLMTLDPGHFHAALLQKTMIDDIAPVVFVYAPEGQDVREHLRRIEQFNTRPVQPTAWEQRVYTGPDYLDVMLRQAPGQVVVIAGVNSRKTAYIKAAVDAGLHVLSDKPMCIDVPSWEMLRTAFVAAQRQGVLVSDIMTQRHEITAFLSKALVNNPDVFGTLTLGTPEAPAITRESVHYLFKYVAGQVLKRPTWYFDVRQQGEGIVDVTTHMIDVVMWECFPEQPINYATDIDIVQARRWPTMLTRQQFCRVTGAADFPATLHADLDSQGALPYSSNGEILYTIKGVHSRVSVQWHYEAPPGGGDTHVSITRGTRSTICLRQGKAQNYRPELYVEASQKTSAAAVEKALQQAVQSWQARYPGVGLQPRGNEWQVTIPEIYRIGHEAHFGKVVEQYLQYLQAGTLPAWEVHNMLSKYYITTQALALTQR